MTDPQDLAKRTSQAMFAADAASQSLGMAIVDIGPGTAVLEMTVSDSMLNGLDVCHGGLIFSLADSAMAFATNSADDISFAVSADMTWLLPGRCGDVLTATGQVHASSGRTSVCDVDVRNQHGELIAVFRGRVRATGRSLLERQDGGG